MPRITSKPTSTNPVESMASDELPQASSAAGTARFQSHSHADLTSLRPLGEACLSSFYFSAKPWLTKDAVLGSCSNFPDIDFR